MNDSSLARHWFFWSPYLAVPSQPLLHLHSRLTLNKLALLPHLTLLYCTNFGIGSQGTTALPALFKYCKIFVLCPYSLTNKYNPWTLSYTNGYSGGHLSGSSRMGADTRKTNFCRRKNRSRLNWSPTTDDLTYRMKSARKPKGERIWKECH